MQNEKRVSLIGILKSPDGDWHTEDYASCGARGCFSEFACDNIREQEKIKEDYEKRKEIIFRETSGRGHGAVLDQAEFVYSIDNLSRASTLFLCGPQYAEHLQQSLRRATAERGFFEIEDKTGNEIMKEQFSLYEKMQSNGIPSEDARFILPLNTKTTIETKWNARELMHVYSMSKRMNLPNEVKETVELMYNLATKEAPLLMKDRENNLEVLAWMPSSQLFAKENPALEKIISEYSSGISSDKISIVNASGKGLMTQDKIEKAISNRDEALLSVLKHYHFTFLAGMSLATFHQATRQRTWDQSVQAIPDAVFMENYIIPPSIQNTNFEEDYMDLNEKSILYVKDNISNADSFGVIPHSLRVYDLIHVNGWNAIHSIGKRTCKEAQWEIRKIANKMANLIRDYDYDLGKFAKPQGIIYGKCPEKNPCGLCFKK